MRAALGLLVLVLAGRPALAERPNPLVEIPQTDATLSILEPHGDKECHWLRMDAATKKKTLVAQLPSSCVGVEISWSHDGSQAFLWSNEPAFKSVEIDIASGKSRAFPNPKDGLLQRAGYDREGRLHAVTIEEFESNQDGDRATYAGKTYVLEAAVGVPALTHDFVLAATGKWKHVETKPTSTGACDTLGISVASILDQLGPTTSWTNDSTASVDGEELPAEVLGRLRKAVATEKNAAESVWRQLHTDGPPNAYVRIMDDVPTTTLTAQVLVVDGQRVSTLPVAGDDPSGTQASVYTRGSWIIIAPGLSRARLFDVRTKKMSFEAAPEGQLFFWPDTARRKSEQK